MRMRRKSKQDERSEESDGSGSAQETPESDDAPAVGAGPRAAGPWDESEVELDEEDGTYVNLGALAIKGRAGVEVRLQADQATEQIQAVMLVAEDGAMELRPFAAPRNESIWDDIRQRLAAEANRRGGKAAEVDGPYGKALQMILPAKAPDGQEGTQKSTVLGITGPRWLLRVSTFGRPAAAYRSDGLLEQVLQDVVVIRGGQPMSPGEALPLVLPAGARRVSPPTEPS
jgi:hypothetical protein